MISFLLFDLPGPSGHRQVVLVRRTRYLLPHPITPSSSPSDSFENHLHPHPVQALPQADQPSPVGLDQIHHRFEIHLNGHLAGPARCLPISSSIRCNPGPRISCSATTGTASAAEATVVLLKPTRIFAT